VVAKLRAEVDTWQVNQKTKDDLNKYMDYVTSSERDMTGMRMFNFIAALGFNLSTAMMQFFTLPTTTLSLMAQMNGNVLSNAGKLSVAIKDGIAFEGLLKKINNFDRTIEVAMKHGFIKNSDEAQLLRRAWDNGKLQAALVEDYLGGTAFERRGIGKGLYKAGEKLGSIASAPITAAEQSTRIASLLALYRSQTSETSTKNGFEAMSKDERFKNAWEHGSSTYTPREFMAIYGVDEAHAIFGKAGRNVNQRGIMGSLIFPFMTHPMQIMELMLKQARDRGTRGRRALLTQLAMYVMFAGMYGIPAMELWEELIEAYARIFKGTEMDVRS
jgi:hypothetical protein